MNSISSYDFLERAASGTTGVVWKARHVDLGRIVAIKELSAALRENPPALERFRAEAARLAELDDEHIVRIYDYLEDDSGVYIVEEWVDGETVEAVLRQAGRLAPEQSVGVMRGALLGLAAAHDRQLVHGDVSPTNILLDTTGTSKMIDFGVAGPVGATGRFGTPAYMSPEAAAGVGLVPASDVYSAAAVLFTLLSGKPPMLGADVVSVLRQHRESPPPRLEGHGPVLREVLQTAMAKDPQTRPADARAFLEQLEDAARRRFGSGWLARSGVAGLVVGGVGEAVLHGGAAGSAVTVVAPVVSEALDQEAASESIQNTASDTEVPPASPSRWRGRAGVVTGGVLVLAAAATALAFAVTSGGAKNQVSSRVIVTPSPVKATHKGKPVALIRPASGATVSANASIVSTYVVSGACTGHGAFKSYYRFSAVRVPTTASRLGLQLTATPGADFVSGAPVTVTCPGFTFPLTGNGVDKLLTSGTIGQQVRIVATDVTKPPGLPANIAPDQVYVVINAIPQFTGKGLGLRSCNASAGAHAVQRSPYPCLPADTTYRISLPISSAATTCEGKPSTTVSPVDVSCHSTGTLMLVIRTYAAPLKAATPTPSG